MADDGQQSSRSRLLGPIAEIGGRAASTTLKPFAGAMGAAVDAGISLERRAFDRVLDSSEIDRIILTTLDNPNIQAALDQALRSDGVARLIDSFFDSGLFDRILTRVGESEALWQLVDRIATSPMVLAAVSQQGLGFADQVGDEVRGRSNRADDWLERAARRLIGRDPQKAQPDPSA
jgi:hypothetical protein